MGYKAESYYNEGGDPLEGCPERL